MLADYLLPVAGGFLRPCSVPEAALMPVAGGFSRRLRCFVVALVLMVGQGLMAQQALAQVRAAPRRVERPRFMQDVPGIWIEQMSELKGGGGLPTVAKAVQQNFPYSLIGKQKPNGSVYVSFWVSADGQAEEVKFLKGSTALLDTAAVRAVQALPAFVPGRQHDQPVGIQLILPIWYYVPD